MDKYTQSEISPHKHTHIGAQIFVRFVAIAHFTGGQFSLYIPKETLPYLYINVHKKHTHQHAYSHRLRQQSTSFDSVAPYDEIKATMVVISFFLSFFFIFIVGRLLVCLGALYLGYTAFFSYSKGLPGNDKDQFM